MKNISCTVSELIKNLSGSNLKLTCFGTGAMAKEALVHPEIADSVIAFTDNDFEKHNRHFVWKGMPYPIISPQDIPKYLTKNSAILIASSYFDDIIKQLEQIKGLETEPCYIYPLIQLNSAADSEEFYEHRLVAEAAKEYRAVLLKHGFEEEEIEKAVNEKISFMRSCPNGTRPVVIPRIMIMPSTRCNLRCEGCSSLFPLFKQPEDVSIEQLKQDVSVFFGAIDECIRLTIGGEPFLYPHIKELLEFLLEIPNLHGIMMFTNSTIMPKDTIISLLRNKKITVNISDYGHIEKMAGLVNLFEKENINFDVLPDQTWTDMGGTEYRNKAPETVRYEYLNCEQGRLIKALYKGRLYICARSARMHALNAYSSEHDYTELGGKMSVENIREKIKTLFFAEYADACNYCDLGKFPSKLIPAGIQMNGAFKKSRYTLVHRDEYAKLKKLDNISYV